ncbi:MAG: CYTH domain-containing protein [Clostridiales bacterium]|nr:CYTH domain-containing protein [Clostridiales bacterium]
MEIERKFLISELPDHLSDYPCHQIEQGYLCTDPVVRIRRQDDSFILTYKSGGMMSREEYNLPLSAEAYEHLRPKTDGIYISKKRYCIPFGSYTIELDIFEQDAAPLILAEVEFPSEEEANAFVPPAWFREDVTWLPYYHNSYISRHGYQAPDNRTENNPA